MISKTRLISLAAALVSSSALAACMGAQTGSLSPVPLTPTQRFTLQVEPGIERIALAVHETGLSASQAQALTVFANAFSIEGAPILRIEAPSGDDAVSAEFVYRIKAELEQRGIGPIQVVGYAAPDPRAPVVIGYDTVRAVVPQCGAQWESLTRTGSNQTPSNFGCAITANLAAQIENPRDIVSPRGMTPSDAGRRTVVFDNYRKGEATAAPQEQLVSNGRVSQAVN